MAFKRGEVVEPDEVPDTSGEESDEFLADVDDGDGNGEGMFDMLTHQLNTGLDNTGNCDLGAYHSELEREFGEGYVNHEIMSGDAAALEANAEEDGPSHYTFDLEEGDPLIVEADLQWALLSAVEAERKRNMTAQPGPSTTKKKRSLPSRPKSKLSTSSTPKDVSRASVVGSQPLESTSVRTEAIDEDTELITLRGANSEVVQDQRFPYLHTEEALKGLSAALADDMDDSEPYSYPLLPDSNTIRVFSVEPAESVEEPIKCTLGALPFSSLAQPKRDYYQTVSYAWGETDADGSHLTHSVYCDGKPLRITGNLHSALKMIRGHLDAGRLNIYGKRAFLWADAISIDQANLKERNHMVHLMDRIYHDSSRVLVWLGESDEGQDDILANALDREVRTEEPSIVNSTISGTHQRALQ
jgi:hypothetical protein